MPNSKYRKGRAFEYERRRHWLKDLGSDAVIRAAGSRGMFDLIAFRKGHVTAIQCKVVDDLNEVLRMEKKWKINPPLKPSANFHQTLEVKVTGSKEVFSFTV